MPAPPIPVPSGSRTHFTFHMYVDPHYGDDALAAAQNPSPNGPSTLRGVPLQEHPNTFARGNLCSGYLQHAPYSFLTVTAALAWIRAEFPNPGPYGDRRLPWTNPTTDLTIDYIVIHCLPGLYGPKPIADEDDFDPDSGLPWNGETFPLNLLPRVSIQGSSALDTIFDARGDETFAQNLG